MDAEGTKDETDTQGTKIKTDRRGTEDETDTQGRTTKRTLWGPRAKQKLDTQAQYRRTKALTTEQNTMTPKLT